MSMHVLSFVSFCTNYHFPMIQFYKHRDSSLFLCFLPCPLASHHSPPVLFTKRHGIVGINNFSKSGIALLRYIYCFTGNPPFIWEKRSILQGMVPSRYASPRYTAPLRRHVCSPVCLSPLRVVWRLPWTREDTGCSSLGGWLISLSWFLRTYIWFRVLETRLKLLLIQVFFPLLLKAHFPLIAIGIDIDLEAFCVITKWKLQEELQ